MITTAAPRMQSVTPNGSASGGRRDSRRSGVRCCGRCCRATGRSAPITVYRALDFLMENGLVHRIESRNAYLACAHDHDAAAMVAFLICERCGSVGEIPAAPVAQSLNAAARASGFAPKLSVVEITGTCAHCQRG